MLIRCLNSLGNERLRKYLWRRYRRLSINFGCYQLLLCKRNICVKAINELRNDEKNLVEKWNLDNFFNWSEIK